jgi:hypothetical protein
MRKFVASVAVATAVVTSAAFLPLASSARASTITDAFFFRSASNVVLAYGSFSYDSSLSGVLGYTDLSSFSVGFPSSPGQTYNLAFAEAASPYSYFAYDTSNNTFVPGTVSGYGTTLAGAWQAGYTGFFFDALATQANVNNNDGILEAYSPDTGYLYATSYSISQTPLPSTWTMLIAGFAGFGFLAYRGTKKNTVLATA